MSDVLNTWLRHAWHDTVRKRLLTTQQRGVEKILAIWDCGSIFDNNNNLKSAIATCLSPKRIPKVQMCIEYIPYIRCLQTFLFEDHIRCYTNSSRAGHPKQCDCFGICNILTNQQMYQTNVVFFYYWQNVSTGRLCPPGRSLETPWPMSSISTIQKKKKQQTIDLNWMTCKMLSDVRRLAASAACRGLVVRVVTTWLHAPYQIPVLRNVVNRGVWNTGKLVLTQQKQVSKNLHPRGMC